MDKKIWLWLAFTQIFTTKKLKMLIEDMGGVRSIYYSNEETLREKGRLTPKEANELIKKREEIDIECELRKMKEKGINFVYVDEEEYPEKLRPYDESPLYLFYKGSLPKGDKPAVAMVGARACSNYGRRMAKEIARDLSRNNVQIISGMARGIDTYSQLGAVEGKTPTFAVLGCGVDICYPTENVELYEDILENGGGIISEFPPGSEPLAWHFPLRNRIISALSDKIAVIEAKEKSGSLITVEWALEQGKDIYALPGRAGDALSAGCNRLLKVGAGVLTDATDILKDYDCPINSIIKINEPVEKLLEKDLLLVYIELGLYPKSVQTIIEETRIEYTSVMEILLKLQLMGLVEEAYQNHYARTNAT